MKKLTILILTVVNTVYICLGGVIFSLIESTRESETRSTQLLSVKEFLENNSCVSLDEFEEFVTRLAQAYDEGVLVTNRIQSTSNWDVGSAIFFSVTAVTTIGYGNITPSTDGGRIFCILFILLGIPLMGIYLGGLGANFKDWMKSKRDQRTCVKGHPRIDKVLKVTVINVVLFSILIFIPSAIFSHVEGWTYGESVYYAIVSLTTVGFGDFYVGGSTHEPSLRGLYRVLIGLWVIVGLAVVATLIADISQSLTNRVTRHNVKDTADSELGGREMSTQTENKEE